MKNKTLLCHTVNIKVLQFIKKILNNTNPKQLSKINHHLTYSATQTNLILLNCSPNNSMTVIYGKKLTV